MLIVGFAASMGWLLAIEQVPQNLARSVPELISSPHVFFLAVMASVLLLGCFIDGITIKLLLVPIFLPLVDSYMIDRGALRHRSGDGPHPGYRYATARDRGCSSRHASPVPGSRISCVMSFPISFRSSSLQFYCCSCQVCRYGCQTSCWGRNRARWPDPRPRTHACGSRSGRQHRVGRHREPVTGPARSESRACACAPRPRARISWNLRSIPPPVTNTSGFQRARTNPVGTSRGSLDRADRIVTLEQGPIVEDRRVGRGAPPCADSRPVRTLRPTPCGEDGLHRRWAVSAPIGLIVDGARAQPVAARHAGVRPASGATAISGGQSPPRRSRQPHPECWRCPPDAAGTRE